MKRLVTLLEVSLVALLVPTVRIAIQQFPSGDFRDGILRTGAGVTIVAPLLCLVLVLQRRKFKHHGLTLAGWTDNLKIAVVLCFLTVALALPVAKVAGIGYYTGYQTTGNIIAVIIALCGLPLLLWILRYSPWFSRHIPTALACLIMVGLWVGPFLVGAARNHPFETTLIAWLRLVIVAGIGEEIIFRGYIQTKLNDVFGRPYALFGIQFGLGLIIASLLFGFVHIFNGFDLNDIRWSWGVSAFVGGMFYGLIREKTGSIVGGALLHGIGDSWVLLVGNVL